MAAKRIGSEIYAMKKNKLLTLIGIALVGLGSTAWAGPHGGGGGSRGAPAFSGGGFRAAPVFRGNGAYFSGRGFGAISRAPNFYYGGAGAPAVRSQGSTALRNGSMTSSVGRTAAISRQQNRVGSLTRQNARVSNSQTSSTAVQRAIANHHVFARHDANWHRDWDKHRAHFDHGHVFVFVDGFWWGLYPWDYYPYYADGYYPYDYYDYYPYNYDDQSAYVDADQYGNNATVSAVQSQLAKLGYYRSAIDGVVGDETQAALARYQEDHNLSVTGTLTAATLQSLGLPRAAS
jgi:putative peptidoglycan binding protein